MDNDPAILALLEAFAQDVEEGAQLMEMDAQEAQEDPEIEEMPDPSDDDDPPTPHDPELDGQPRGVRRPREEPVPGADEDAYWQDEYGDGDANMVRLRPMPQGAAMAVGNEDDDDWDSDERAGRFSDDEEEEGDEDERASEGMILPRLNPKSWNLYMLEFWRVLCRMGTETTSLITRVVREGQKLSPEERHRISVWIKYWTGYMIEFHYHGLGQVISTPTGPGGEMERISGTSAMMCEIWRLTLVLNYENMGKLRDYKISDSPFLVEWLLDSSGVPLDCPPKQPVEPKPKTDGGTVTQKQRDDYQEACVKYAARLSIFNAKRRISETPVLRMRQSQVRILLQFLAAKMKLIPYSDDIRHLFSVLELKTAMFFCLSMAGSQLDDKNMRADLAEEIKVAEEARQVDFKRKVQDEYIEAARQAAAEQPDLEPVNEGGRYIVNRDFWIFCTSYWYPFKRAMYLLEMMPRMNLERGDRPESYLPEGAVARMEAWARRSATNQGDNFQDRLAEAADDSMRYPGDDEWMRYKYPDESTNVDVVLKKLRGEAYYDDYHTQLDMSPTAIMNQVNTNWLSTTFVLLLFDRYMNTYKGVNWRSGYVIENAFLDEEETHDKWTTTLEPMLVNVFSHYWLMFKGKVLPINNIYTSLCVWMYMLRKVRGIGGFLLVVLVSEIERKDAQGCRGSRGLSVRQHICWGPDRSDTARQGTTPLHDPARERHAPS